MPFYTNKIYREFRVKQKFPIIMDKKTRGLGRRLVKNHWMNQEYSFSPCRALFNPSVSWVAFIALSKKLSI